MRHHYTRVRTEKLIHARHQTTKEEFLMLSTERSEKPPPLTFTEVPIYGPFSSALQAFQL